MSCPDPDFRELALTHIEDDRRVSYHELRWRWRHEHGVGYDDFWAAPDIRAEGLKSGTMEP